MKKLIILSLAVLVAPFSVLAMSDQGEALSDSFLQQHIQRLQEKLTQFQALLALPQEDRQAQWQSYRDEKKAEHEAKREAMKSQHEAFKTFAQDYRENNPDATREDIVTAYKSENPDFQMPQHPGRRMGKGGRRGGHEEGQAFGRRSGRRGFGGFFKGFRSPTLQDQAE